MLSRTILPVFTHRPLVAVTLAAALGTACRPTEATKSAADSTPVAAAPDSQYTPTAMIAAFRRKAGAQTLRLGPGAATHRDTLVTRYVHALERADTAAFRAMQLDVGEFAWLYYLDSPMARTPYELDPDVMWMQIASQSTRGLTRALARFGGRSLGTTATTCEAPTVSGSLRLHACSVTLRPSDAPAVVLPLSIVERDGRFKFVGYGNPL
jgi:hypothetical protein